MTSFEWMDSMLASGTRGFGRTFVFFSFVGDMRTMSRQVCVTSGQNLKLVFVGGGGRRDRESLEEGLEERECV
jgi:hypothetical protein